MGHPDVTDDAQEHVASIVSAFVADRSFNRKSVAPDEKPKIVSKCLDRESLIETYRKLVREGNEAAKARLAFLVRVRPSSGLFD